MISPRKNNSITKTPQRSNKIFLLCLAFLLCASVIVVFAILNRSQESEEGVNVTSSKKGTITEVTPAFVPIKQEESPVEPIQRDLTKYNEMKALSREERKELRIAAMQERPINLVPATNRIVNTATEQLMGWIFTTEVGELPPPLPKIPDHEMLHFTEILMSDNSVYEDDSERTAEVKEIIQLAKKELADYIKNGGEPVEFFKYYRGVLEQAYKSRQVAKQSVQEILREDPEIALEYLAKVNERLEQQGIKKITIHPKQLQHFGIIQEETEQ